MTAIPPHPDGAPNPFIECLAEHAKHLGSLVHATAKKHRVSREAAEDAVQETFVAALQAIGAGTAACIPNRRGWFALVGRHKCVDAMRAAKKRSHSRIHRRDEELIDPSWQDDSPMERAEPVALIRSAIFSLGGIDRRLVVYCDLWEHSYAEAATRFGLTVSGVHGRIFRARATLRLKMKSYYLAK